MAICLMSFLVLRENWEEYGGRHERTGLGEAVWRSEDPFSFHRLVTHDGADKEAAELMMQAHVVVLFLRLMMVMMAVMMMKQTLSSSGCSRPLATSILKKSLVRRSDRLPSSSTTS